MHNSNNTTAQSIFSEMKAIIEKYHLEITQRYPSDLALDLEMLKQRAHPGAKIAWVVGHNHTHLVSLGIHPDENLAVTYLTNMSSDDRFLVLNVSHGCQFKMNEVNRDEFTALSRTEVPYKSNGNASSFWLTRQKRQIGHINLTSVGTMHEPMVEVTITPVSGITDLDRVALQLWASHAVRKWTQSLFTRTITAWADPILDRMAA